jgi:hypothetical protein
LIQLIDTLKYRIVRVATDMQAKEKDVSKYDQNIQQYKSSTTKYPLHSQNRSFAFQLASINPHGFSRIAPQYFPFYFPFYFPSTSDQVNGIGHPKFANPGPSLVVTKANASTVGVTRPFKELGIGPDTS